MGMITEALADALLDTLKLIPFLFITYLAMEYLEHKSAGKAQQLIRRSGRLGPLLGAAAGMFPQCGFSAAASNLYAAKLVSRGTLIAVFLATSDEMLPILISEAAGLSVILRILAVKFLVGMAVGFLVDILDRCFRKRDTADHPMIHELCEHEHCDCQAGIWPSALRHTVNIAAFLLLFTFALNVVIGIVGEDSLAAFMQSQPVLSVVLTALAGLIPNCAPSVLMTQLYLQGALSFGAAMAGLLVGAGVGILVLFRMNTDRRDNLQIVGIVYAAGVIVGLLLELL